MSLNMFPDLLKNLQLLSDYSFLYGVVFGATGSWWVYSILHKNRIDANEDRIKTMESQMKAKEDELKKFDVLSEPSKQSYTKDFILSPEEISALKTIRELQKNTPSSKNVCSVEDLVRELKISSCEANEILKKLRKIGFFESIWDNVQQYPNLNQPINSARPGRLSKNGMDYINDHQSVN